MKHYPRMEMDVGGNHDFPRLARESNFYFNLYRGRVDWKVIDSLDIDRLIRERDLESLQSVFSSILSCNLTNEYDVKVLDPNFVKLFRLSQLGVDYLQYCRNYLDHCVILLQEQLQVALHEVEQLQQDRNTQEDQIKQLTKKLRAKTKASVNNGATATGGDYGIAGPSGGNVGLPSSPFRCLPCGKMFVSAVFLQRHIMRRHPEQVQVSSETENLHLEIRQLQDRLRKAEELLERRAENKVIEATKEVLQAKEAVETVDRQQNTDNQIKVDRTQNTDEELSHLKDIAQCATASKQQSETDMRSLLECLKRQSEEIESLKNQLKSQHSLQESWWQNRIDQLEQRHQADIESLRSSLGQPICLTASSPVKKSFGLKEFQEKEVQHSQPEMLVKGTQVEIVPESVLLHTSQEAFIKPAPNELITASPLHQSSRNMTDRNQRVSPQTQWPDGRHPQGMLQGGEAMRRTPEIAMPANRDSKPPGRSSPFASGKPTDVVDLMSESSTDESSEGSDRGSSPLKDVGSGTEETSSSSSEKDVKMLSSLANKPQVVASLREDVHGLMLRSLQELGIDPEWTGIPNATYKSVRATLQHQREIAPKGQRDLVKLRQDLSREVESKAKKIAGAAKEPVQEKTPTSRNAPVRPPPPRSSPKRKSENEYTAEPRREQHRRPVSMYEEVSDSSKFRTEESTAPVPPVRKRSFEKPTLVEDKPTLVESKPTFVERAHTAPVPPPRVTPSTAELLADMEKLRQQGALLKAEAPTMAKSNLKTSASTGIVAKKRVVFEDERDDYRAVELGLSDSEFGMFHPRSSTGTPSTYPNDPRSYAGGDIHFDDTRKSDNFILEGSGEPARPVAGTNVNRLVKEIEHQLQSRPKPVQRVSSLLSTSDLHGSQLDLILDDLSSS